MNHRCITFERREAVGLLTLNRPERANAIDRTMLAELNATCDAVEADETIRALVVTGAGGAFSSGFDLKEQAATPPVGVAAWREVLRDDFDTVMRFWHLSKPTVAAVRGPALAGGCELALACDVTVAAGRRPLRRARAALRRRHRRDADALAHRAQAREGNSALRPGRDRCTARLRDRPRQPRRARRRRGRDRARACPPHGRHRAGASQAHQGHDQPHVPHDGLSTRRSTWRWNKTC